MKCAGCEKPMEEAFPGVPHRRKTDSPVVKDGLRITISGTYGELVDGEFTVLICRNCVEALVANSGLIEDMIEQINS